MRAVAADWSGAARGEQRHLWLAECRPSPIPTLIADGVGGVDGADVADVAEGVYGVDGVDGADAVDAPRLARLEPMTRTAATARLLALAERDPALVVGLDFGFSLPSWYLDRAGITTAAELWAHPARLEGWLADCPPPFWGRPGRPRPALAPEHHWRRTELAASPRPKSMFQIGGAGAVGTASLRGMPVLHQLQRAGFAVWPMDPPRLPLVLEVWPRLAIGPVVKARPEARRAWLDSRAASIGPSLRRRAQASTDAFDAAAAALGLAAGAAAVDELPEITDPVIRLEGWIWGVPPAAHRPPANRPPAV